MRRFYLLLFLVLPLLWGCSAHSPPRVPVSGRVAMEGHALDGLRVGAWPADKHSLAGRPAYLSAPSASKGAFRLDLPPGRYYLMHQSTELFGYYGRNPISVTAQGLEGVNLALVHAEASAPKEPTAVRTGVLGQVTHRGEPLAGAMVHVYLDLSDDLKGMGYLMAGPTDGDGIFQLELSPGTYYLVARSRRQGSSTGPLEQGDFLGYYPGNPVRLDEGELVRINLPVLEVPAAVKTYADQLFGSTRIRGRILDKQGRPLAGMRALLYKDPAMLDRPLYVSQPTEADGQFVLSFPEGGTYYLSARSALGAAPAPGELYGTYDGSLDHALEIETGELIESIEMRVEPMW